MSLVIFLVFWACVTVPVALTALPFGWITSPASIAYLFVAPALYIFLTIVTAGLVSRFGLKGMVKGKIERSLKDPVYGPRRIHASAWTFIFYFKPIYFLALSIAPLKAVLFRLFGYKGNLIFTVYPDTWLRDIPLLDVGKNAYLSNKSSIATNICLSNNKIIVDGITIGEGATVGHASIIGPGTKVGNHTQIEASVTSGIRVRYDEHVQVGELCGIQHGVKVGANAIIEAGAILGLRVVIGPGVRIAEGSHIHSGLKIRTQEEADSYRSEETGAMTKARARAVDKYFTATKSNDKPTLTLTTPTE